MSNIKIKIHDSISEINKNQWNNVVENSDLGSLFHRYEWIKSIEEAFDYDPKHLVAYKNQNPIGIFPNEIKPFNVKKIPFPFRLLTSFYPKYGGPVITSNESETVDLLLKKISELSLNATLHRVRTNLLGFIRYGQYFESEGYKLRGIQCNFVIDLNSGWEDILSEMSHTKRRNIKKAHSQEYEVVESKLKKEALKEFYKKYSKTMERSDMIAHPFPFFVKLKENIPERVKLFNAKVDGKDVGYHMILLDREQSSVCSFISAFEKSDYKYYPSEILNAHAVRWAIDKDFETYDMGVAEANFADGLFRFKEEFGGTVEPILRWEKKLSEIKGGIFNLIERTYRQHKKKY